MKMERNSKLSLIETSEDQKPRNSIIKAQGYVQVDQWTDLPPILVLSTVCFHPDFVIEFLGFEAIPNYSVFQRLVSWA